MRVRVQRGPTVLQYSCWWPTKFSIGREGGGKGEGEVLGLTYCLAQFYISVFFSAVRSSLKREKTTRHRRSQTESCCGWSDRLIGQLTISREYDLVFEILIRLLIKIQFLPTTFFYGCFHYNFNNSIIKLVEHHEIRVLWHFVFLFHLVLAKIGG